MDGVPSDLKTALAGRYELERVIGRGGMATVYIAKDVRHRRDVAVKVLRPDLAAVIGTDRFLKEIEISANLTHPHIVPLYDSGEANGQLFYVMPFIKGESLRSLLLRETRLKQDVAISLITPVVDAVQYAHRNELLHRDLKPENILLSEGHPMVTDFGIAKAVSTAADDVHFTRTGLPIGTPGYMSPEQAAGSRSVDGRTDVYGLACVLYEMLVGDIPGTWLTDEAVKLGRFVDALPEHRRVLDTLSGRVEQALVRAMALQPAARMPTPQVFLDALNSKGGTEYSETQAAAIVKRAAEDQALNPTEAPGLTMGAIEQVAAEVGISPERVQSAARDVATTDQAKSPWQWFFGGETDIRIDRFVECEVREAEFPLLVEEIRTTLGNVGHTSTLGRSISWTATNPGQGAGRMVQVMITPRGGRTRIFVQENLSQLAGGLFGGIMGGGGGGGGGMFFGAIMGTLTAPVIGLVGWGAIVAGAWRIAQRLFDASRRRRTEELNRLIDRLSDHIRDTSVSGYLGE